MDRRHLAFARHLRTPLERNSRQSRRSHHPIRPQAPGDQFRAHRRLPKLAARSPSTPLHSASVRPFRIRAKDAGRMPMTRRSSISLETATPAISPDTPAPFLHTNSDIGNGWGIVDDDPELAQKWADLKRHGSPMPSCEERSLDQTVTHRRTSSLSTGLPTPTFPSKKFESGSPCPRNQTQPSPPDPWYPVSNGFAAS